MRFAVAAPLALLALAACSAKVDWTDKDDKDGGDNVHIAMNTGGDRDKVSFKVPGIDANLTLPSLNIGANMDLDGMKLAPGTKVSGIDVQGHDGDKDDAGRVKIAFTDPTLAPTALIDHYRRSAIEAGYSDVAPSATGLTARKDDKQFALSVGPEGSGSRGEITMIGKH